MKIHSSFFSERILSLIQHNIKVNQAAADSAARFIDSTSYWLETSYDELREMVFSPSLKRSWFVLSDGSCPSCGESVPMYNWVYDPIDQPWKMKCPHCSGLFPKNDFKAYYDSGLDEKGIFREQHLGLLAVETARRARPLERLDGLGFATAAPVRVA
ncbi:MAG: hypothetical protein R3232_10180, partial [Clostridia bacterium]|nr:hypothetical protein [Clostridia bacterium]